MTENQENTAHEERRAANMIWNAAGDYSFQPDFAAFDENGEADPYLNTIIGAVRRYYDYSVLAKILLALPDKQEAYADLLWLGLENCAYHKARKERPALETLRQTHALHVVARAHGRTLSERLQTAHFQLVLQTQPSLDARERQLLAALQFDGFLDTKQLAARMTQVLHEFFHVSPTPLRRTAQRPAFAIPPRHTSGGIRPLTPARKGDEAGSGQTPRRMRALAMRLRGEPDEQTLRAYVEDCFGVSSLGAEERTKWERLLCTGSHADCRLHVTRGVFRPGAPASGTAVLQRDAVQQQRAANRAYFRTHLAAAQLAVAKLAEQIRFAMLAFLEASPVRGRAGRLLPERVWRGPVLHDERVFTREECDDAGSLAVDLLLDGSASQRGRQETVALQAYIIAESLSRCGIPVRVCSFCSVSGCTVLHLFRDYRETERNSAIFDYTAAGWNRDGLALRLAGALVAQSAYEHRLLILLSDASPNDDHSAVPDSMFAFVHDYTGEMGIQDAAAEAHRIRQTGVPVLCVFTGDERDLAGARQIYGSDFVRARDAGQFADAVGRLLCRHIQRL